MLRAQLALTDGNPSPALQALEPAARFDLAAHGVSYNRFFGQMCTVYLRGEAYLAAREPVEALREFDRIIAHRGIVLADPVDAFARPQRARILAAAGNTTDARRAYEDLLGIWANGDGTEPLAEACSRSPLPSSVAIRARAGRTMALHALLQETACARSLLC